MVIKKCKSWQLCINIHKRRVIAVNRDKTRLFGKTFAYFLIIPKLYMLIAMSLKIIMLIMEQWSFSNYSKAAQALYNKSKIYKADWKIVDDSYLASLTLYKQPNSF